MNIKHYRNIKIRILFEHDSNIIEATSELQGCFCLLCTCKHRQLSFNSIKILFYTYYLADSTSVVEFGT